MINSDRSGLGKKIEQQQFHAAPKSQNQRSLQTSPMAKAPTQQERAVGPLKGQKRRNLWLNINKTSAANLEATLKVNLKYIQPDVSDCWHLDHLNP